MYKQKRLRAVMIVLFALMFTMTLFMPTVYAAGGKGGGGTTTNAAPVIAQGDQLNVSTNENQACTVNLTASDPNRDPLIWSISTNPVKGTATLGTPTFVKGKSQIKINYTPNIGSSGTDSFVTMVDDGEGGTDTIIVNVTIIAAPKPNSPPVNNALPTISGEAVVGKDLTASTGNWTDPDNAAEVLTYNYLWQKADDIYGSNINNLNSSSNSYTLVEGDAGKYIRVEVTATDSAGASSSEYSAWNFINLPVQEPANNPPVNDALPTISGEAVVGKTLYASTGTWNDTDNTAEVLTYTYQWQWKDATGTSGDIIGATASSYIITRSDIGKAISVKVTAKDSLGGSSSAFSDFTDPVTITTLNYVALGDSIATGTIYPGASIESYVPKFYRYLQDQNPNADVTLQSFANNGDRTNELYDKLGLNPAVAKNDDMINAVASAEIITISIGGNNLMQAAKDDSALGGYNFNVINDAVAEQGVTDFNAQWKPIIEKIKSLSPNAQIIWYTMYNPYNESDLSNIDETGKTKHAKVDSYLFRTDGTGINDIILNNTSYGYSVAQVYKLFDDGYKDNMGAVTYFYPPSWDLMGILTRNPHPKAAGQNIILEQHKQVYKPINY